jgi:hypothetical protein
MTASSGAHLGCLKARDCWGETIVPKIRSLLELAKERLLFGSALPGGQ